MSYLKSIKIFLVKKYQMKNNNNNKIKVNKIKMIINKKNQSQNYVKV